MGTGLAAKKGTRGSPDKAAAFAQMAERYRRKGDPERAASLCREGLSQFPDHLSGRVTLGWALLDLGQYDAARGELEQVLKRAPDNLTAIRGLAELHDRADSTMLDMHEQSSWPAADEAEAFNVPAPDAAPDDDDAVDAETPTLEIADDVADLMAAAEAFDTASEAAEFDAAGDLATPESLTIPDLISPADAALAHLVEAAQVDAIAPEAIEADPDPDDASARDRDDVAWLEGQDLAAQAALIEETGLDPDLSEVLAGLEAGLEDGVAEAQARQTRDSADRAKDGPTALPRVDAPGADAPKPLGDDARADLVDAAMAAAMSAPMVDAQDRMPLAFEAALADADDRHQNDRHDEEGAEDDHGRSAALGAAQILTDAPVDHAAPEVAAVDTERAIEAVDLTDDWSDDLLDAVAVFQSAQDQAATAHVVDSESTLELDAEQDADLQAALEAAEQADAGSSMASSAAEAREAAAMAEATELALAQIEAADRAEDLEAHLVSFGSGSDEPDDRPHLADITPVVASADPDFLASDTTPLVDLDSPLIQGHETSVLADAADAMTADAADSRAAEDDAASEDDRSGFASMFDLEAESQPSTADAHDSDAAEDASDPDEFEDVDDLDESEDAVGAALAAAHAGAGNQGLADQLAAYSAMEAHESAPADHGESDGSAELAALIAGARADEWTPPTVAAEIPPSVAPTEEPEVHPPAQRGTSPALGRLELMLRNVRTRRLRLATEPIA